MEPELIKCPWCFAEAGKPCTDIQLGRWVAAVHHDRYMAAQEYQGWVFNPRTQQYECYVKGELLHSITREAASNPDASWQFGENLAKVFTSQA